jgi:hypothetical protein
MTMLFMIPGISRLVCVTVEFPVVYYDHKAKRKISYKCMNLKTVIMGADGF